MKETRLTLNGRSVRHIEAGQGAPVIFAAGLGISADFYKPNMQSLAHAGFRAIAPDVPGFGKTRGKALGCSIAEMKDHLVRFAAAMNIERAHFVGHSIGCQVALQLAAEQPRLAQSVVLAGPTGGYGHRMLHQVAALSYHAVREPWRLMKAVLRDYVRLSPFTYVGTWVKAGRDDPLVSAARVACPALILIGTRDHVPGDEFIAQLAHKLRDAEVVRLAGGQHGLPLDAQRQFDHAVIEFLRSC